MPNGLPEVQLQQSPNVAARFLQLQNMVKQSDAYEAQVNAARMNMLKQAEDIADARLKRSIDINERAANILATVNSPETFEAAKEQLRVQFPQYSDMVDQLLPTYDPNRIEVLRGSLLTEKERMEARVAKDKIITAAPGSAIIKGDQIIDTVPTKEPTPKYDLFESPEGDQVYVAQGDPVPRGFKKVRGSGGTTINIGGKSNLTPTVTTQVQKDIMEGARQIRSFKETAEKFNPEYLTYLGKGERKLNQFLDKLGMSTEEQRQEIREYEEWFRQAKADFIAYRKWATGVAGGEKEMAEIATSFPDPVKNSPTQYEANLKGIEDTTREILKLNQEFLDSGIDPNQPIDELLKEAKEKAGIEPPPGFEEDDVVHNFDSEGNLIE